VPKNEDVDAWFARYENPMKPVVRRIRAIVLGADPGIEECIKWQAPTFTYRGNLASFFPKSKQHATLMFHTGALIPGKHPRLEGGGGTSRVMKIGSVAEANAAKRDIERVVEAWCEWRHSAAGARAMQTDGARSKPARYDEKTADRIRRVLGNRTDVVEKRMFGGLCFMVNGQMCCGLTKTDFMVRVGKDAYEEALSEPHARPMNFTGRPLKGMVYVDPAGYRRVSALARWVQRGLALVTNAGTARKRRPASKKPAHSR
jgi:uncharacterized protein YdhG (YjbR/CyaY superfamily)/TfoX/Sxy family transcriptional regulator of competence genes